MNRPSSTRVLWASCLILVAATTLARSPRGRLTADLSQSTLTTIDPNGTVLVVGDRIISRLDVRNTGDVVAADLTAELEVSAGSAFGSVRIQPEGSSQSVEATRTGWRVVIAGFDVAPGETKQVAIEHRFTGAGLPARPVTFENPEFMESILRTDPTGIQGKDFAIRAVISDPTGRLEEHVDDGPVTGLLIADSLFGRRDFGDAPIVHGGSFPAIDHCLTAPGEGVDWGPKILTPAQGFPVLGVYESEESDLDLATAFSPDADDPTNAGCSNTFWLLFDDGDGEDDGVELDGDTLKIRVTTPSDLDSCPSQQGLFLNVLIDLDQSLDWSTCSEWVLEDHEIMGLGSSHVVPIDLAAEGLTVPVLSGDFRVRVTLTAEKVADRMDGACWDGSNGTNPNLSNTPSWVPTCFECGETEDYILNKERFGGLRLELGGPCP